MEFLLCPNFNTLDRNSMSLSLFVYMFFMLENNANPVVRLQNTNVKMPRGSTTKLCVSCKAVIGVATKTCKVCQTIQPMRQRLAKKLEKFQSKKETWLQKHKKNKTTTHVLDEASVLVEKLNTLGQKAVVFIARPGKKTSTWHTHVIHPRWQLTDQAGQCLDRMKDLYELMINGWTSLQMPSGPVIQPSTSPAIQPSTAPSIQPSASPAIQPSTAPSIQPSASPAIRPSTAPSIQPSASPAIQPSTAPSIQPSASPAIQPSTASSIQPSTTGVPAKKKKKRDNKKDSPGECSHGGEDQFYPVKQVLKTKKQKGKLMEFVEWEPCSMCGKTWSPQWVEKRNTKK
ncbi:platelet glycoprotein Ib alpha chain-like isoform X1 [Oryzias latipes]|uniref:platelet glycoprotein Ib alpha chain-like isoform X1 n=2 Tax=Oryzias latipes TaxID=8090 RepID=UPI000CE21AF9|nr:platelet glycoprotein Ib alpha chain-like isoform X1 [Oryzias latipes]